MTDAWLRMINLQLIIYYTAINLPAIEYRRTLYIITGNKRKLARAARQKRLAERKAAKEAAKAPPKSGDHQAKRSPVHLQSSSRLRRSEKVPLRDVFMTSFRFGPDPGRERGGRTIVLLALQLTCVPCNATTIGFNPAVLLAHSATRDADI
jgi:hypothetical protein